MPLAKLQTPKSANFLRPVHGEVYSSTFTEGITKQHGRQQREKALMLRTMASSLRTSLHALLSWGHGAPRVIIFVLVATAMLAEWPKVWALSFKECQAPKCRRECVSRGFDIGFCSLHSLYNTQFLKCRCAFYFGNAPDYSEYD
ncbi:hypothetical protein V5799_026629 [Amblyomma americanum]|uniref:Uncharacterized protein n=1 Tax=Amblyomma americanum TaxID=6943 RepID=A0AAQ4DI14_AMBAM